MNKEQDLAFVGQLKVGKCWILSGQNTISHYPTLSALPETIMEVGKGSLG